MPMSSACNTSADNGWKYVTATGSGPYSFTLDYSLIIGGSVSDGRHHPILRRRAGRREQPRLQPRRRHRLGDSRRVQNVNCQPGAA